MKLYILHVRDSQDHESQGYVYYGLLAEARIEKRALEAKGSTVELTKGIVTFTRAGILKALNRYGGHPDNG